MWHFDDDKRRLASKASGSKTFCSGVTLIEALITLAIVATIGAMVSHFLSNYEVVNARISAEAASHEMSNITLNRIASVFAQRKYDQQSPHPSVKHGFYLADPVSVVILRKKITPPYATYETIVRTSCQPIPDNLKSLPAFSGLKFRPDNPTSTTRGVCLNTLKCPIGSYPQTRIFDTKNLPDSLDMKFPDLTALKTSVQKDVIGNCVYAKLQPGSSPLGKGLHIISETVVYDPRNPNKTKIVTREKFLPFANLANLQILP